MTFHNIAILGATGEVGKEILNQLQERKFPYKGIRLFASQRSAGKEIVFDGKSIVIEELNEDVFIKDGIIFSALDDDLARHYVPRLVHDEVVIIDNSNAFRKDDTVPLVIPEVNPEDIKDHQGILANPNCSTIIALVAVNALHKVIPIDSMIVSTYQAVSGAGSAGIYELEEQIQDIALGKEIKPSVFPYQIAYNLIPQIGGFDSEGNTSEEMKLLHESRKILHHDSLEVSCTCVRVPVMRSHSESISLFFKEAISVSEARDILMKAEGVRLVDNPNKLEYPMPLDTSYQDNVFVGRLREIQVLGKKGISLWCSGDQIRKGAATNAVQIAEKYLNI